MEQTPLPTSKEALSQLLQERGKTYLPQWQQNPENPDFGMTLLEIYAQMQGDTLEKMARLPEKWKTSFYQSLACDVAPQTPAQGFVYFALSSPDVPGVPLSAGTALSSSIPSSTQEAIPVQTTQDVLVSPGKLVAIYESYDDYDHRSQVWDLDTPAPFPLFSFSGENQQKHGFYLLDDQVFALERQAQITLHFLDQRGNPLPPSQLAPFLTSAQILYSQGEKFIPFSQAYLQDSALVLEKKRNDPAFAPLELGGGESRAIAILPKDAQAFYPFAPYDIRVQVQAQALLPQLVLTAESQVDGYDHYFPFGEKPGLYDQVYFGDNEVFSKKGALITLSFLLEFVETPVDLVAPRNPTFKFIMPKSSVVVEPDFDISVDTILFEYFNGYDYVTLFPQRSHQDLFSPGRGTQRQKCSITFPCPETIAPVLVGGTEVCAIRCRILKMKNQFKVQGNYISPVLSQTALSYDYPGQGVRPRELAEENHGYFHRHLSQEILEGLRPYQPIQPGGDGVPTVYLGFDKPLHQGPVGLLFALSHQGHQSLPTLAWSYSSPQGFLPIHCQDETKHLSQTGLVRFLDLKHHQRQERFGQNLYWIRLEDVDRGYDQGSLPPSLSGIYLNATSVATLAQPQTQYFTLEDYEEKPVFSLGQGQIHHLEVFTRLGENLSGQQIQALGNRLTEDGEGVKWISWDFAPHFRPLETKGYQFGMDVAGGLLLFSQPSKYLLPPPQISQGIRVLLHRAGGQESNLPVGGVDGFALTEHFVNFVKNPLPLFGGADQESPQQAMSRKAQSLSHRNRAVTIRDYEKLAESQGDFIEKVRCFPHRDGKGEKSTGNLTLVVLCKDYQNAHHFFPWVQRTLQAFFQEKRFVQDQLKQELHIVLPQFVQMEVAVEVSVASTATAFQTRAAVEQALEGFFHPITGNFSGTGFAMGTLPGKEQIVALLLQVPGVNSLQQFVLTQRLCQGGEWVLITPRNLAEYPYALPCSGAQHIHISSDSF